MLDRELFENGLVELATHCLRGGQVEPMAVRDEHTSKFETPLHGG